MIGKTLNADGYPVYSGAWWWLARPHFILPLYATVIGLTVFLATTQADASLSSVLFGFVAGALVWTLFEYILHRWMLHNRSTPFMKKIFWEALHKEHHLLRTMEDMDHHGIHPAISLPIVASIIGVTILLSQGAFGIAGAAGWAFGYSSYEGLHWVFHAIKPGRGLQRIPLIRYLHNCHEVHHIKDARKNYGFVTMFWDRVFRTYRPLQ